MSLPLLYRWKNDPANSSSIPPILICSSTSTVCSPLGGEKLKLGATLLFRSAPRGFRNLMTLATLWVPQWQYHCWKSQPASSLLPAERRQVCVQRRGDVKLSSWKLNNVPRIMYPWVNLHSLCAEKETLHPSVCHLAKFWTGTYCCILLICFERWQRRKCRVYYNIILCPFVLGYALLTSVSIKRFSYKYGS